MMGAGEPHATGENLHALAQLDDAKCIHLRLTDPTTGSHRQFRHARRPEIAEPGALIGFAGPRVIEQTSAKNPEGFQRSEFLLEKGFLDGRSPSP